MRLRRVLFVLLAALTATGARAQDVQRRYMSNPADEDWSFLATAPSVDPWDPAKYIPLGRERWFITVSGEVRYRPEGFRIRPGTTRPSTIDNYLLQRYLFGSDVHFGPDARVFVEFQSGVITGAVRSPRPTDRNRLDLHQAVFTWHRMVGHGRFTVDVGRHHPLIPKPQGSPRKERSPVHRRSSVRNIGVDRRTYVRYHGRTSPDRWSFDVSGS